MGGMKYFVSNLRNILEAKEESGNFTIDVASTLVDMLKKSRNDETYKDLGIDEYAVFAQGWEFFFAGYLGTRDLFGFLMYELACHSDIQDQLYSEIRIAAKGKQVVSLEEISRLPYLNACLKEASRRNAAFIRLERFCNKDWEYDGLRIPKGIQVIFPMFAVHMNPENFPNPDRFEPSRFLGNKEQDAYAYMRFGHGPRGCLGQRFALEMLKVLVVSFLIRFKLEKRPDTILETYPGGGFFFFMIEYKPILLDLVKRDTENIN